MSRNVWVLPSLWFVVFVSALSVVYSKHVSRELFGELRSYERKLDELEVDWSQLQLEYGTWSMDARVDEIARRRLGMYAPDLHDVRMIQL
ncbi:MAG: cell division protein FtsL [Pseudomonadota bacterium]